MDFLSDPRFKGIERFPEKLWLSSPTMHGDEQRWVDEAIQTNWVSTVGENINAVEKQMAEKVGVKYAVGLSCGTAALHMGTKLAGERLYGQARPDRGTLEGKRVFCSDMTFDASINPVAYEDGEAVFIDTETDTWNMSPEALEKAFELYPEVKLVVVARLYGTPGKMEEINPYYAKTKKRPKSLVNQGLFDMTSAIFHTGKIPTLYYEDLHKPPEKRRSSG